jgi:hypothetical protein
MPSSKRDLLFLFGILAMAVCLMVAGFVIYPDSQRIEVRVLAADPQPTGGIGRNH